MKKVKLNLEKLKVSSFVTETNDEQTQTVKGGVLHQIESRTDCGSSFCPSHAILLCPTAIGCPPPPEDC